MAFSEKLYALRKKSGLSQEQLAEQLGVSRQAISKWESGQSIPENATMLVLSNHFHVSLDYLMKDDALQEGLSPQPAKPNHATGHAQYFVGLFICLIGVVCLIVFGLISIFNPAVANQIGESSIVQLNGNSVFLLLCIVAILIGAMLLLKNKNPK